MLERFTQDARAVVTDARDQARRLGHPGIGTSHLLLALVARDDPTGRLLRDQGLDVDRVTAELTRFLADWAERDGSPGRDREDSMDTDDAAVLAALGIDLAQIRQALEGSFGPGALERAAVVTRRPPSRRFRRFRLGGPGSKGSTSRPGARVPEPVLLRIPWTGGRLPFGGDARTVLELAVRESVRTRSGGIGTEHLLLGLLRAGGSTVAAALLDRLGVDRRALRSAAETGLRRPA